MTELKKTHPELIVRERHNRPVDRVPRKVASFLRTLTANFGAATFWRLPV